MIEHREPETQGGRQQERLAGGWLFFVAILLSAILAIIAGLLARGLGIADPDPAIIAGIVVLMNICTTAPRTLKQLALIVAIATAGGFLTIVACLAILLLDWGYWGSAIGGVLFGCALGAGFIVLCYRRLGIEFRRYPENSQA